MTNTRPPLLPVPRLEDSLAGLVERVRPLVGEDALARTASVAEAFSKGTGRVLQARLEGYALSQEPHSWLTRFWEDAYLEHRGPLNGALNYLTTMPTSEVGHKSKAELCGTLVWGLTNAYLDIAKGENVQEAGRSGPLCMDQYQGLFAACRIPQAGKDAMYYGLRKGMTADGGHIVVLYRGNIYELQVADGDGVYGIERLSEAIAAIIARSDSQPSVGILTAAPRDEAALIYERLCALGNKGNFECVHSAIFALCIDDAEGDTPNQAAFGQLYGRGENRWFDKCVQVIVGDGPDVGFNNEHTGFDASIWVSTLIKLYEAITADTIPGTPGPLPELRLLEWNTDEDVLGRLREAEEADALRGRGLVLEVLPFTDFGASAIKAAKASPDAFFHIALQLAYYRHTGGVDSTYEAVAMRQYHEGRTEAMRPSTNAALAFVKAMGDISISNHERATLARIAFDKHVEMIAACQRGEAPERHLFGLQALLGGDTLPEAEDIFSDPGYRRLCHDSISSSGLGGACMNLFCFAPVVEDGLGIGYIIGAEGIRLGFSAKGRHAAELPVFAQGLHQALRDLHDVLSSS